MASDRDARTVELDREQLKSLLAEPGSEPAAAAPLPAAELAEGSSPHEPATARTTTLDDPLTMALLAEAARGSRTIEMDPQAIADAFAADEAPDLAHPHLKRRG